MKPGSAGFSAGIFWIVNPCWGWLDHDHIVFADAEQITPDQLSGDLRKNYDTFVAFWKSKYPEKYAK